MSQDEAKSTGNGMFLVLLSSFDYSTHESSHRCIHRIKPVNARDNVYSPATFPPNADMGEPVSPTNLPDLRVDEQQEVDAFHPYV